MHGELAGLLSSKLLVANGSKSNLQLAMCAVPRGLALILFNIFINSLDERLLNASVPSLQMKQDWEER